MRQAIVMFVILVLGAGSARIPAAPQTTARTAVNEVPIVDGSLSHHILTNDLFHIDHVWMRVEPGTDYHRWLSTGVGKRAILTLAADPKRFEDKKNTRILTGSLVHSEDPSASPIVHVILLRDPETGAISPVTFETDDQEVAAKFGERENVTVSIIIAIRQ